jgi:two-component SAPR family response regulator
MYSERASLSRRIMKYEFIVKPFSIEKLIIIINNYVNGIKNPEKIR